MIATIASLVVYLACAFGADGSTRYGVFSEKSECEQAVAQVRGAGLFASDCVAVEVPQPRNK